MDTKLVDLKMLSASEMTIVYEEAGKIIREGGMVAFPTETVYGLGANALDGDAAARIYAAKGRPSDNPLIAHIADEEALYEIAAEVSDTARILMKAFWPGPMTLVFKKKDIVPDGTTGGLKTVAVRMPDHMVARNLIRAAGVPIAAPSANISGRPSPTSAKRTMEDMKGRIEMILDGGDCRIGIESTIIDVTEEIPMILRPGFITLEMLQDLVGEVLVDPVLLKGASEDFRPKAPGMKYRHYAPKASMTLVEGEDSEKVVCEIKRLAALAIKSGKKVGIICTKESEIAYDQGVIKCIGSRKMLESVAHNLYEILREFDECDVDYIYSEAFPEDAFGNAVMNRMVKAAGHSRLWVAGKGVSES